MNTKKAAEAMTLLVQKYWDAKKQPNWKYLGSLVTKRLEKHPSESVEEIAEQALRAANDNAQL